MLIAPMLQVKLPSYIIISFMKGLARCFPKQKLPDFVREVPDRKYETPYLEEKIKIEEFEKFPIQQQM